MNRWLVALGAFAVGAVVVFALAQAGGPSQKTVSATQPVSTTIATTTGAGMMGATAGPATGDVQLRILHVQRGCHVWRSDERQAATMRIALPRGGRLSILDQDVDAHQLVQLSGPRLRMPAPMAMMDRGQVRFLRPGVYRLATRAVELPGQSMPEAETIGPDNHLRLIVTVT